MRIRFAVAKTYMLFSRWTFVHQPLPQKTVIIGAPHTSYWDGVFMAACLWLVRRPFSFLVKDSIVRIPVLGAFVRAIGGIPVDRTKSHGIVGQVVQQALSSSDFTLVLAPKGTRSKREYWKSGFYRIALEADIPVTLGFIDKRNHTLGWGPSIHMTGDVQRDMDAIRAFYEGKQGKRPELTSVPRLRLEAEPEA